MFGRGFEELEACAAAGVPVTVVPGITSAISVPSAAGIPVTHRGVTHEFVVVSGHVAPDHPDSLVDWAALAKLRGTIVLLMAVERIEQFAAVLVAGGRPAGTPVTVIQEGTLRTQRVLRADWQPSRPGFGRRTSARRRSWSSARWPGSPQTLGNVNSRV